MKYATAFMVAFLSLAGCTGTSTQFSGLDVDVAKVRTFADAALEDALLAAGPDERLNSTSEWLLFVAVFANRIATEAVKPRE